MFGQSASTNTFGQPTAFGTSTTAPFGSMNPQPQQSSLFGQTSTPSLFGMSQPSSIFGASNTPSQQTSAFGSQQPSTFGTTSLFGNTNQQQNNTLFGNSNRFGMTTGSSFSGALGSAINVPAGTTVKFVPQTGTDTMMKNGHSQSTSINIRLQCITCMREYDTKSLEELRHEDYNANRKGSQQQNSLFGASSINTGNNNLFGNASSTNTFGAPAQSGSLFQNKSTFGSIAPTTTTNSFFGSNLNTNKTNFFSTPTNTATGFQTQTQPSLFGNSATTQPIGNTTSFFGTNNLNTNTSIDPMKPSMFGQPTSQSTMFASAPNQNLSAANKPAFGATATPFGAQPQTNTSLFANNTANTGSVFGATSQPSLFNTNTSTNTGLGNKSFFNFSSTAPSFNTGMGTTTSTANMFGTPSNTFGTTSGPNLFGSNLNSNSFNFNPSSQPFQNSNTSGLQFNSGAFGSSNTANLNTNSMMNQQSTLANPTSPVNTEQIIARLQTLPYGSPQIMDSSFSSNNIKTKFTTDPKTLNQYKISAKSQAEVKVQRVPSSGKPTTLLFDGLDDESQDNLKCAQDIFSPRPNVKKLVLNKSNTSLFKNSFIKSPTSNENEVTFNKENRSPESPNNITSPKQVMDDTMDVLNKLTSQAKGMNSPLSATDESISFNNLNTTSEDNIGSNFIPKCGIMLSRTDYYTIPTIEECDTFYNPENDSCVVDSFTVGRIDYGSIYWKGPLNVKGVNLDEIVHIRRKEVIVYPDDDAKPPIGDGLNRPAQITLDQVWPIDKASREFIKDPQRLRSMKYSEKVEAATIKLDAIFKEYRPDTGSWVFTVKHFSKYGLDADDEDVEMDVNKSNKTAVKNGILDKNDSIRMNGDSYNQFSVNASADLLPKETAYQINPEMNGNYSNGFHLDSGKDSSINNLSNFYNFDNMYNENEFIDEKSNQLKTKDELNVMRSALFVDQDDEVDTVTKKCKNLSFSKSATSHQVIPSLFPSKLKSAVIKRRKLNFEPIPSKYKANVYSIGSSPMPRANFANGSNRFCMVLGGQVIIFGIDFLELDKNNGIAKLEDHLINNSTFEPSNNALYPPLIKTNKFPLNVSTEINLNALIEALYGELSETLNYSRYQERIRRIENWLFNFNKTLPVPEKPFSRIIHFLTTNELEFAVTECINSKQPRLSYLITSGPFGNKSVIMSQLDQWKRSESDIYIDKDLLKLYVLLSGQSKWSLSTSQIIDVFEDLQWTQQLILILLYKNRHVNDLEIIGTNLVKSAIAELATKPNLVEYHLLAQNQAWVAIASCPNLLDSWFLHESLSSYNVIVDDIFTNKSDSINLYLASQVTDLRWAIFFVLHIRNDYLRYFFTKELLIRNSTQLIDSDVEKFLNNKLSIKPSLMAEAKLFYWKSHFNYKTTAFNLIHCGQFNEAHDILTEKVFPELVINEDYNEIVQLINKLRFNQHLISNWNVYGAGIYEVFIELLHFDKNSDIAKYKKLIENFNVHQLRCPSKRHFLCQSQMARVANIIHAELNNGMFAYNTSVPDDYALLELRSNAYKILETDYIST